MRTTLQYSCFVVLCVLALLLPATSAAGNPDPCSNYGGGCDKCVTHTGCGWCSWGQGSCQTGTDDGPTSSICYGATTANWYFGTCSDECYLTCGITCSGAQQCVINRDNEMASCSCQTKPGIIIGAVLGSIFCCCLTLTIFVIVRRNSAMRYARLQSAQFHQGQNQPLNSAPYAAVPANGIPVSNSGYGYQPPLVTQPMNGINA